MELYQAPEVYERIIHYDETKNEQIRLSVKEFRGIEYLSLRKYYQDYDEEWRPTKDGINMPLDFCNSRELFSGLEEILSLAESKQIIEEHFLDLLQDIYTK